MFKVRIILKKLLETFIFIWNTEENVIGNKDYLRKDSRSAQINKHLISQGYFADDIEDKTKKIKEEQ